MADEARIRSLRGLPPGIQTLDIRYTAVAALAGHLESLTALDLRGSRVETIERLPAPLRSVTLGGSQDADLPPLPASLEDLELVNTGIQSVRLAHQHDRLRAALPGSRGCLDTAGGSTRPSTAVGSL